MKWNKRHARYALFLFLVLFIAGQVKNHLTKPVYPDPETCRLQWPPQGHLLDASQVVNRSLESFPQGTTVAEALIQLGFTARETGSKLSLPRAGVLYRSAAGWSVRPMTQRERWVWRIPMDIHRCAPEDLERITGIGPALALRIHDYVQNRGYLGTLDDLEGVPGVGPGKLKALKEELEME